MFGLLLSIAERRKINYRREVYFMVKMRISTLIIVLLLVVGATIRLTTGSVGDLFPGEWYRYIWPLGLVGVAGYVLHLLEEWLIKKINHKKKG